MKKIISLILALTLTASLTGCNYQLIDTKYNFDKAQILLQDGTIIEGEVQSWKDYDGDQIQVKIDGVTYLVHSVNVTLIG